MNSEPSGQYQYVYNVGLLDDLHNYFPGLLYQMERFQTLPQVFQYIRQQINSRFNLYNYGANLAAAGMQPYIVPPVYTAGHTFGAGVPMRATTATPATPVDLFGLASLLTQVPLELWSFGNGTNANANANANANGVPGFMNPVVVRPTPEDIARATELVSGSTLTEGTVCSICQDTIIATDSARKLRTCGHSYHQFCIDQWFQRSVFCPSCRHDVRT
jgi:hypothetical protein